MLPKKDFPFVLTAEDLPLIVQGDELLVYSSERELALSLEPWFLTLDPQPRAWDGHGNRLRLGMIHYQAKNADGFLNSLFSDSCDFIGVVALEGPAQDELRAALTEDLTQDSYLQSDIVAELSLPQLILHAVVLRKGFSA